MKLNTDLAHKLGLRKTGSQNHCLEINRTCPVQMC